MRRLAALCGALVLSRAACSDPTAPAEDGGLDAAVAIDALDAPIVSDVPSRDVPGSDTPTMADAPVRDAIDAPVIVDAGADAPAVDGGRDAPLDAPRDAACAPYCDPVTGSYFTCVDGASRCMCGPCSGDPLACC